MNNNIDLKIEINDKKLNKLIKNLKEPYKVRVGVLNGGEFMDKNSNITVAGYGLVNEFGSITKNIPARSFIRMPLNQELPKAILKNKTFIANILKKQENLLKLYVNLGITAKSIVLNAFYTSGFGNWQPNKPSTIRRKGSSKPLIDTGRLRQSINYNIVKEQ